MMKEKSWNLQGMGSIENSMDPRAKEKHEKEHEDSKGERKSIKPVIISRITRSEPTISNQVKEMEVVMKNNVWKTYEWKHCEIQK
jgi:hypothetical protein